MLDNKKNSCFECARKRRVCTAERPCCHSCQRRGIICPGYDKKPLKWISPNQTRSKCKRTKQKCSSSDITLLPTPEPAMSSIPCSASFVTNSIYYYNVVICPDMETLQSYPLGSPYIVTADVLTHLPPCIVENLVCAAITHRILHSAGSSDNQDSSKMLQRLQKHRGHTINLLRTTLANNSVQLSDTTLAAVLALLLSEIQQGNASFWRQHCDGAFAIMTMRSSLQSFVRMNSTLRPFIQYFVLTEIFGATTSPRNLPKVIARQMEISDLLTPLFGLGVTTAIPCPTELLKEIVLINHLRSVQCTLRMTDGESLRAAMELLPRICDFNAEAWATRVMEQQIEVEQMLPSGDEVGMLRWHGELQDWARLGRVYREAVLLYGASSLIDCTEVIMTLDDEAHPLHNGMLKLSNLKRSSRNSLLSDLQAIAMTTGSRLRKFVVWPLVMAGIQLREKGRGDKRRLFINDELVWTSRATGAASALVARDFLNKMQSCCGKESTSTASNKKPSDRWDDLFDEPYMFGM